MAQLSKVIPLASLVLVSCGTRPENSASTDAGLAATKGPSIVVTRGVLPDLRREFGAAVPFTGARFEIVADAIVPRFDGKTLADAPPEVSLPKTADGALTIAHRSARLRVTLLGASPSLATIDEDALVHSAALGKGSLIRLPGATGHEDFVRFATRDDLREVAYRVDLEGVAGLRLSGGILEALDASGDPLLRTPPPTVFDAAGKSVIGELVVEGCAYDRSDALPWGRAVTAPGSDHCTVRVRFADEGLIYPILVDPAWSSAGTLAVARSNNTASLYGGSTACQNTAGGSTCALIVGGTNASGTFLSSTEMYNNKTRTWASAGNMLAARAYHGHAGQFVGGGQNSTGDLASVESYSGTAWSSLGNLPGGARRNLRASRFQISTIFAGGETGTTPIISNKVDTYGLMGWGTTSTLNTPRSRFAMESYIKPATSPLQYRTLIAGGVTTGNVKLSTAELLGGATLGTTMTGTRSNFASARASNGIYLVGGGISSIDVYDMASETIQQWRPGGVAANLSYSWSYHSVAVTGPAAPFNTRLLAITGESGIPYSTADIFDLSTGARTQTTLASPHSRTQAVTLDDGTVIIAGGNAGIGAPTTNVTEKFVLQANGAACSVAGECASGFCVDKVCCNVACAGICEACAETGKVGTCSAVSGASRHGTCPGVTSGLCGNRCDGSDRLACQYPGGSVGCGAAKCSSGSATGASFCDGAGACKAPAPTLCGAYACNTAGTACNVAPCATNADCATGFRCDSVTKTCVSAGSAGAPCTDTSDCLTGMSLTCVDGTCCTASSCTGGKRCDVPGAKGSCKLPYGAACTGTTAPDCATGNCVDGVCCDKPCNEQCAQCNLPGTLLGFCSPVPAGGSPVGARTACGGTGTCAARCDGTNVATCGPFAPITTSCGAAACTAGVASSTRYCDGVGACAAAAVKACVAYTCGPTDCKSSCLTSADCATTMGYACKEGACVTTGELGTACTDASQCKSGFCTGSSGSKAVCCSVETCGEGSFCADTTTPALAGTCVKASGATCTKKEDCSSGFCTDGVCCDALCDGQCEACDVMGAVGTCVGVKGAPHGMRAKCFDGGGDVCSALQCDGSTRNKCIDFAKGPETECGTSSCVDGKETPKGRCDFMGGCKAATLRDCAGYACNGDACRTECSVSTDCSKGFACDVATKKCIPQTAACDSTGLQSVPSDGTPAKNCAPFRCNNATGDCYGACTNSEQCSPGSVCDGTKCQPAPGGGGSEDSGGCSYGTRSTSAAPILLVALAFTLARRRRQSPTCGSRGSS